MRIKEQATRLTPFFDHDDDDGNNKQIVGGIFFDMEKAFDCVNHNILLTKMDYYGIRGIMFTLSPTNWDKINIGVPQGSVLGLLLFLVYINDLPSAIQCTVANTNSSIILFADDTYKRNY